MMMMLINANIKDNKTNPDFGTRSWLDHGQTQKVNVTYLLKGNNK